VTNELLNDDSDADITKSNTSNKITVTTTARKSSSNPMTVTPTCPPTSVQVHQDSSESTSDEQERGEIQLKHNNPNTLNHTVAIRMLSVFINYALLRVYNIVILWYSDNRVS